MPYNDSLSERSPPLKNVSAPGVTPTSISTLQKVRDVKLSPLGSRVLYQVVDFYKPDLPEVAKSELWVADTFAGKETKSRFLTYGFGGVWDPLGQKVFFFAAGTGKGSGKEVKVVDVAEDMEPRALEGLSSYNVQSFAISPDGMWIAFVASVPTPKTESDVKVYSSSIEAAGVPTSKLYLSPCPRGSFASLEPPMDLTPDSSFPAGYGYIESFTWASNGQSIVYRLRRGKEVEYAYQKVVLKRVYLPIHLASSFPHTNSMTASASPPPPPPTPMNGAIMNPMDNMDPPKMATVTRTLKAYPRSPSGNTIICSSGHLIDLQPYNLDRVLDSRTIYVSPLVDFEGNGRDDHDTGDMESVVTRLYGETEDAVRVVDAFSPPPGDFDSPIVTGAFPSSIIAVEVATRTETHIDAVFLPPSGTGTGTRAIRIFETGPEEAIWFNAWDARVHLAELKCPGQGEMEFETVVGVVLSSVMRHEPPNVWVVRARWRWSPSPSPQVANGESPTLTMLSTSRQKISEHLRWLVEAPKISGEVVRWTHMVDDERGGEGGTPKEVALDGIIRFPPGYSKETSGRLPTVLFVHGGPYRRDIPDYMPYFSNWRELLASNGYVVLSPNYRGSQGRGHDPHPTRLDEAWKDCLSMVRGAVERGIADPDRLGVAGWSHGGSLVAWGVTRLSDAQDIKFKAAIVGAGVADWDAMIWGTGASVGVGGGGSPELEMAISGMNPWIPASPPSWADSTQNVNGTSEALAEEPLAACNHAQNLSPMSLVSNIDPRTSFLILHGEKDERVPVSQAVGLYRGATRAGKRVQLIVYPREGHGFVERKHVTDVCEQVLQYFGRWL
ncbi:hypothetical protein PM082_010970 [Marasmius tenuissimus]|nr:hypothetical protein PM082_010970 [Marasmius tenuissimus]